MPIKEKQLKIYYVFKMKVFKLLNNTLTKLDTDHQNFTFASSLLNNMVFKEVKFCFTEKSKTKPKLYQIISLKNYLF